MSKKFELNKKSVLAGGKKLYQIRALKDFETVIGKSVKAGEAGGFVESEDNLSQEGRCWIADEAIVMDNAKVADDALINRFACIGDSAKIKDRAIVSDEVYVRDSSMICDCAFVFGSACIRKNAIIRGKSRVYGDADVCDKLKIDLDYDGVFARKVIEAHCVFCKEIKEIVKTVSLNPEPIYFIYE